MATSITDILNKLQDVSIEDKEALSHWCNHLVAFYKENDRHSYSEITEFLINSGGIDYAEKIIPILENFKSSDVPTNEVKQKIAKLIDHLNLEIVRIRYINDLITTKSKQSFIDLHNTYSNDVKNSLLKIEDQSQKTQTTLDNISQKNEEIETKLAELQLTNENISKSHAKLSKTSSNLTKSINIAKNRIKNFQNESIAILGIFSAVVLSFVGGLAFSTSVLQNIHKASIYRLAFITSIIGMVLFNILWALMSFLLHFCGRRKLKNLAFKTTNIILVAVMLFSILAYLFKWGSFEQRITDIVTQTYVETQDEGTE